MEKIGKSLKTFDIRCFPEKRFVSLVLLFSAGHLFDNRS